MFFDTRSNERYEFSDEKVEYSFGHFSRDETFSADLVNASELGLCMLCSHRLTVGQEIVLRDFMGASTRTAEVVWTEELENTSSFDESAEVLFKVGLKFSQ